jgi:hypothetical protein
MKTYSAGLTALLTGDQVNAHHIGRAIKLELVNDDVVYMADVHDDTEIEAHVYEHAPGLKVGDLELILNEGPISLDVEFQTHADAPVTYADVQDGLLDGAILQMGVFLRDNLANGIDWLFWGPITDIRRGSFGFVEVSAEGPTYLQTDIINQKYQSMCRHRFTSPECGISAAGVTFSGTIVLGGGRFFEVSGTGGQATDFFNVGLFKLTSGRLKNRAREIRQSTLTGGNQVLELYRSFGGIDPQIGDTCTVRRGCTHDLSTTHGNKFYNNMRRYGGDPRLESDGEDVIQQAADVGEA